MNYITLRKISFKSLNIFLATSNKISEFCFFYWFYDTKYRYRLVWQHVNTFTRLDNMLQVVDLQNIQNPFNGTLIERKQDTWSFLKTETFFHSQRNFPSRLVFISHAVFVSYPKPFLFMKIAIISFLCYAYWTATFSFPSFSYWQRV